MTSVSLLCCFILQTAYNLIQREVSSTVLPMILDNASRKGLILHLWHINPHLVLRGFVDFVAKDSDSINRILDICQETKV